VPLAGLGRRIVEILHSPAGLRILKPAPVDQAPERYVPDVSLANAELGLPPPIPLDEAIARTARWHCEKAREA
jgi:dTDP-glucose 4,6-dehydratase